MCDVHSSRAELICNLFSEQLWILRREHKDAAGGRRNLKHIRHKKKACIPSTLTMIACNTSRLDCCTAHRVPFFMSPHGRQSLRLTPTVLSPSTSVQHGGVNGPPTRLLVPVSINNGMKSTVIFPLVTNHASMRLLGLPASWKSARKR